MRFQLSEADFLGVFRAYNEGVWPAQLVLLAVALLALAAAIWRRPFSLRTVHGALAALWLWAGAAFWLAYFSRLGPAGYVFGAGFLLQSLVFVAAALRAGNAATAPRTGVRAEAGALLIAYALVFYPLLGSAWGRAYPNGPTFGAPCPVTIFTFGLLLLTGRRVPVQLYLIPLAWSLLGTTAAVRWGVAEDFALPVAGLLGTALFVRHRGRGGRAAPAVGVGETPAQPEGIGRLH